LTIPEERTRTLIQTERFLRQLTITHETPDIPERVREEARRLLRHFPDATTVDNLGRLQPQYFSTVFDWDRLVKERIAAERKDLES
jgi:hypothetical protein